MGITDPRERMYKAIEDGKYATEEAWCRAILADTAHKLPEGWKLFAQSRLSNIVAARQEANPRGWAETLKAKELAGGKLHYCQQRAWRSVLGDAK